jgi:glycine/D-amino acid oxidase-like deaminating enzyme
MGHGARLYGPGETIDCDKLVVAAGSWVSGLLPELRLQLRIERRVMGWFGLDGARKLPAGELPIFLFDVDGVWYGMPTPDGLLKAGNHTHFSENLDAGKPAGEPNAADEAFFVRRRESLFERI